MYKYMPVFNDDAVAMRGCLKLWECPITNSAKQQQRYAIEEILNPAFASPLL